MGAFYYGTSAAAVAVADDDLALLEVVSQLMAGRSTPFLASFDDQHTGHRTSFWMSRDDQSRYIYGVPTPLAGVDAWHVDLLLACADSDDGLVLQST